MASFWVKRKAVSWGAGWDRKSADLKDYKSGGSTAGKKVSLQAVEKADKMVDKKGANLVE
jgi:hypothetical protein